MTGINRMSAPFNVFVHEYFTGGGFPEGDLPGDIAAEALGMLWALLADFQSWGVVRTVTTLDPRLEERIPGLNRDTLPADKVIPVPPDEHKDIFLSLLKRCDAALIIAPESNGILSRLSAQVEKEGVMLLGSSASATAIAGDKEACGKILSLANLPIPKTCTADIGSAIGIAEQMGYPLVLKPLDGVSSEGICLVDDPADMPAALANLRKRTSRERILLQSFVDGIHASVCLLVAENRCLSLSLNRQLIRTGIPFEYRGSEVPFDHAMAGYAIELASSVVDHIPGLNGYVGVDLVIAGDSVRLIEINPRLTTSYIGLRQVSRANPAEMIYEACLKRILPESFSLAGRVVVIKDNPISWGLEQINQKIEERR
jgi:predicted ATP-grasp superfamily ATP-dependent carboligase